MLPYGPIRKSLERGKIGKVGNFKRNGKIRKREEKYGNMEKGGNEDYLGYCGYNV